MIRVQRPSKEPEQNWKDKMEVRKAVLEQYDDIFDNLLCLMFRFLVVIVVSLLELSTCQIQ